MLPGGIIVSIKATINTYIEQFKCKHDFREDAFNTDGISTQTCKKCYKRIKLKF